MKKIIYLTAACALFLSLGANAQTQDGRSTFPKPREVARTTEWKPHVGLLAGTVHPEGGGDAAGEFGVDVGYQPYIPFGLGAEFIHSRFDTGAATLDRNTVWAKATYNFGGDIPVIRDAYVGAALGAVFTDDETAFAGAPMLGFDIPVTEMASNSTLTVGASSKYAIVGDNQTDALSINGNVKYWY